MSHYLISPAGDRVDLDQYFGSYQTPSIEEVEDLMMELPEIQKKESSFFW
jgi:hypothetical protein